MLEFPNWDSRLELWSKEYNSRDFNTTLHQKEKRGGSMTRDPCRERMEDLMSSLDLIDIHPSKGSFTWTNRRVGLGHIAYELDRFMVHCSLLSDSFSLYSSIIPWVGYNHRPIVLLFSKDKNLGPIPLCFNPL